MNLFSTPRRRPVGLVIAFALIAMSPDAVRSQDQAPASYEDWRLLEPAQEMIDYKTKLKQGVFDESSRKFLTKTALPQLALQRNRPLIDRVRRRMRDVLCGDPGIEPKVAAAAMQVVSDFMLALARDGAADMVSRVNAALLVGELRGPGTTPWAPAAASLAALLGDDALPAAVRIAAAAGLARHVEADPAARAADVGPTLLAVAGAPLAGVDPVAADWLRSRSLSMLAKLGANAPAGTAALGAGLLRDAARPIDVRVRAAATVGACVKPQDDTDVANAVAAIRDLATAALDATKQRDQQLELATRLAGGDAGMAGQRPGIGMPAPISAPFPPATTVGAQAYRRDAWRLATLADALAGAGGGGLATVAGAAAPAVTALATALRDAATRLDGQPDAASLDAAIAGIAAVGKADAAGVGGAAEGAAPPDGAAAPAGVDGIPFGDR